MKTEKDGAAYGVVWPEPLGRRSSVLRVQHVEQTYLVRMLLTLRRKEKNRTEKEVVRRRGGGGVPSGSLKSEGALKSSAHPILSTTVSTTTGRPERPATGMCLLF